MDKNKMAFVTLLSTDNYLDAVLVLNRSMRRVHAEYPLLVMVVDTIFTEEMQAIFDLEHICYEKVSPLAYCEKVQEKYQHTESKTVLNTASKIQLFTLKNWDKLVYIDADAIVLQNIDDLFNYPDGAMIKYPNDEMGFSGMFVFCPRNHQEDEFYPTIMKYHECVDGDLLGKTWFFVRESPAHQIPFEYFWHYQVNGYSNAVKAVHFCNHIKPWLQPEHELFSGDNYPVWLYREIFTEIKDAYH